MLVLDTVDNMTSSSKLLYMLVLDEAVKKKNSKSGYKIHKSTFVLNFLPLLILYIKYINNIHLHSFIIIVGIQYLGPKPANFTKSTNSLFQFNCVSISVMQWNPLPKTTCISKGFYIVSDPGVGTAPFSWQMLKIVIYFTMNIPHPCFKNPGLVPIQSTVKLNIIIILLHKNIPHPFKNLGSAPI